MILAVAPNGDEFSMSLRHPCVLGSGDNTVKMLFRVGTIAPVMLNAIEFPTGNIVIAKVKAAYDLVSYFGSTPS